MFGERSLADFFSPTFLVEAVSILIIPPVLAIAWIAAQSLLARPQQLIRHFGTALLRNRERFAQGMVLLACYVLVNRAYRALKVSIPDLNPYWADRLFADLDKLLFGVDPWILSHGLIGPFGTAVLDKLYMIWFPVILLAFAFSVFSGDSKYRLKASTSYFLVWLLLGNVMAIAFASVGPCFYDDFYADQRFVPLMDVLARQGVTAVRIQDYLLATNGHEALGNGISAMPSVHCGLTMLIVMMALDRYGWSWQPLLAFAYHLAILVGSVHLGWHYAVDGIFSSLLIPPIWWIVSRVIDHRSTKPAEGKAVCA